MIHVERQDLDSQCVTDYRRYSIWRCIIRPAKCPLNDAKRFTVCIRKFHSIELVINTDQHLLEVA